jgi:hypothetical protein
MALEEDDTQLMKNRQQNEGGTALQVKKGRRRLQWGGVPLQRKRNLNERRRKGTAAIQPSEKKREE